MLNRYKYIFIPNIIIFLFLVVGFFSFNLNIGGPIILDEGAYLANAAALAGYKIDLPSKYHAGYSLFLVPAFLLGNTPESIFMYVKLINSLLWGFSFLLLLNFISIVFPEINYKKRIFASVIAITYPTWITLNGYAFSESGFVFVFMFILFFLNKVYHKGGLYWLFLSFSVGFLFAIHPKSLPVIGIALTVGLVIGLCRGEWKWLPLFLVLTMALVIFYNEFFHPWLHQLMYIRDDPTIYIAETIHFSEYRDPHSIMQSYATKEQQLKYIVRFFGQVFYLIVGSLGLVFFGLWEFGNSYKYVKGLPLEVKFRDHKFIILCFLTLSYLGTLLISVLMFTGTDLRLDHWIYGRYLEGLALPFLAIGFIFISKKRITWALLISFIAAAILFVGLGEYQHTAPFNVASFWQEFFIRDQSPLLWWFVGVLPLIAIYFIKSYIFKGFIIILVFSASSYLQIQWHNYVFKNAAYGQRQELANFVNSEWEPGTCVRFDSSGYKDTYVKQLYIYNYAFYLFNYNYKSTSVDKWYAKCDGPFISFYKDLDDIYTDVALRGVEVLGGPLLWSKSSSNEPVMEIMDWIEVAHPYIHTSLLLGDGWHNIEERHVWSTQKSTLIIKPTWFNEDVYPKKLILKLSAFGASKNRTVELFIRNNKFNKAISFNDHNIKEVVIPLDFETIKGSMEIEMTVTNAIAPSELTDSPDKRILGVSLHEFKFSK